ncbi:uncharacterized protein LOC122387801 isoform X2 [Amphibalanus amphitrite]|uniref:uncharacterized protein LOC122387801 isoform X2 n=1 Tax=Amphibalanus amphitrite TaxID=1232801 RepID=UPI001C92744A|nr:uncharacterized protein LOC122387801 isoform X2 [Amphibalanus amphitrite]
MPVRRGDQGGGGGPSRFLSLFRRMRADADPVRLVHTAGDEPPSPDAKSPHDTINESDSEYDPDGDRLRASREDNPFLRRLSEDCLDDRGPGEHEPPRRRTSSAGAGDPLSDAQLHSRLVRSPPPSRSRRRTSPFFEIHEKAKIVVIPTSQLRPLKTRQREDVMDRNLQYILKTQQALPVRRDPSADQALSRRLSGATAPPLAPRAISALSVRSGRLSTDRTFDQLSAAALSVSFESKDQLRTSNARERLRYSLDNTPRASPQPSSGGTSSGSNSTETEHLLKPKVS